MQNKKLHICIVTGDFPSLSETFITNKVLELHKRGHKITVIKNNDAGVLNQSHLEQVKQSGIVILSIHDLSSIKNTAKVISRHSGLFMQSLTTSTKGIKRNFKTNLQSSLLNKYPFDIIHFEFSGLAVSYLGSMKKLSGKKVVSCRGTAEKVKTVSEPKRKDELRKLFSVVDSIHCVSDDMSKTISTFCDHPEKIFVNRPSIDVNVFKRSQPYTTDKGQLKILTVGRFTFQKGYLIGLMAIKELKNAGHKFLWKIVGDGPQREEILYHIHAMNIGDCVELLGKKNRDEILALYNEADVFFLPSVYEGIANVCLEAMSMEVPVVSTKSGGMEEVIVHGDNGLLCEVYDVQDMKVQLEKALADANLRKQMSERGRQTVIKDFTLQRQVDVFEAQYEKLVNTNS